jgi:hypothetical protein
MFISIEKNVSFALTAFLCRITINSWAHQHQQSKKIPLNPKDKSIEKFSFWPGDLKLKTIGRWNSN